MRSRYVLAALLACAATALETASVSAKEDASSFLDGLRRLEMHDVAILYLESLRGKPRLPEGVRTTLALEEGIAHLAAARATFDPPKRDQLLETARGKFREFLAAYPKHIRVPTARAQLGNILVEQAKTKLARSKQPSQAANKDRLIREAREYFEEAEREIQKACDELEKALGNYPKVLDQQLQPAQFAARQIERENYMQVRLWKAAVAQESAQAYEDKSPERAAKLEEAAKRYEAVCERWRTRLLAFHALQEAARCRAELGQRKQAVAMCEEILALDGGDPVLVQELQGPALALAMQCWSHPDEKNGELAIQRGRQWLEITRLPDTRNQGALAVRWEMVQLLKTSAAGTTDIPQRKKLLAEALRHAKYLAAMGSSEHRRAALAFIGGCTAE
jgi:tetratricopeptide (TPR) repeat protein